MTTALAGDYPRERAREHAEQLAAALAEAGGGVGRSGPEPELRNLAPELQGWVS